MAKQDESDASPLKRRWAWARRSNHVGSVPGRDEQAPVWAWLTGQLGRRGLSWLVVVFVVGWLLVFAPHDPIDLGVYQVAGSDVLAGRDDLYGEHPGWILPFTYPPFAALVFTAWSMLPFPVTRALLLLASTLCLARVITLTLRRLAEDFRRPQLLEGPWAAAALLGGTALEPVWHTLGFGQINLLLAWAVAEGVLRRSTSGWVGVGVGIAAGVKLTPAIFVGYFLVTRQWAKAAVAAASGLATVALGALILPHSSADFWTRAVFEAGRVGELEYVANQSLNGALWRLVGQGGNWPAYLVAAVIVVIGWAFIVHAVGRDQIVLPVVATALAGLLVSPVSWTHHWAWVAPTVLLLVTIGRATAAASERRFAWALTGAWLLVCWAGALWWLPYRDGREYALPLLAKLAQDAYVWLGLASLALLWACTRTHRVAATRP